jgi:hypothetical protein
MRYIGEKTITYNGIEYPLLLEYSEFFRAKVPYTGLMTTYNFDTFLRLIKEYSTFPYILSGVAIFTYQTASPAALLNKEYDYRIRFYKAEVLDKQMTLI